MSKFAPILLVLVLVLSLGACKKSSSVSSSASSATSSDPVDAQLQGLAGSGATSCGHLKTQASDQLDAASKCAMQAAQAKHPFFVAYDMPGMTVGVAGNADGKLFSVSTGGASGLASGDCPAELRVAPSGRVTCFAPGTFPMGMGAAGGVHGGMGEAPAGTPNPHQQPNPAPAKPE